MVNERFKIAPGKPLISRFRIIAEDGEPDARRLNSIQEVYALIE
jgi:hypothetical protein